MQAAIAGAKDETKFSRRQFRFIPDVASPVGD